MQSEYVCITRSKFTYLGMDNFFQGKKFTAPYHQQSKCILSESYAAWPRAKYFLFGPIYLSQISIFIMSTNFKLVMIDYKMVWLWQLAVDFERKTDWHFVIIIIKLEFSFVPLNI